MLRASAATLAALLSPLCIVGCLVGCKRSLGESSVPDERLPLPTVTVPSFACRDLPLVTGDCRRDADCGSAELCTMPKPVRDGARVALSCNAPIGDGVERDRCETARDCASGLCALAGVCVKPCVSSDDCVVGQHCAAVTVHVEKDGLSAVPACARSAAFPPDVSFASESLSVSSSTLNTVDIGGSDATELVYLGADCDATVAVEALASLPDRRSLFDYAALFDGSTPDNPVVNVGAFVPMLLPNNPAVSPSSGGYQLALSSDTDSPLTVLRATGGGQGYRLDLNVFYAGGGDSIAEGGFHPGSKDMADVFATLADQYAAVGITLGEVREYDVTGALRERYAVLETNLITDEAGNPIDFTISGLEELFRLSAGVDDGGLNVFIVGDMGDVLGISGGIPGALGIHGTASSGVAVAADTTGLAGLPSVLQHELSHQMGLFHTTEMDGTAIEPLADTPVCGASFDRNGDGVVAPRECRLAGSSNLMFWSGTGSELSDEQITVLKASQVLR
jgi:hypothetical protein